MSFKSSGILECNAILSELNEFYNSIQSGKASKADLANAYEPTLLADTIERTALDALRNE
ncbi:MAG: hypothetical protein KJO29_08335, partial [Bacteroidia bacterium]|nr:hypothetical protein [Bacteroidia bacterium]